MPVQLGKTAAQQTEQTGSFFSQGGRDSDKGNAQVTKNNAKSHTVRADLSSSLLSLPASLISHF